MVVFRGDPCGIICMFLTYLAVGYADYVVIRWIIVLTMSTSLWGAVNATLFNIIVFLLIMAHLRAVLTDPGIIPLPTNSLDFSDMHSEGKTLLQEKEDWTVCARCETYRPPRAHHCRICQRCVRRMDHHCPWINNCVGEFNQKYFIQFLVYVGLASFHAITLVVISWLTECNTCIEDENMKQMRVIHCVILMVESLLFGLFVTAIMFDQINAILTDETAVEHVQRKGPFRPRKPKMALLSEVCGRGSPFLWVLPCQNPPRNIATCSNYEV